MSKVFRAPPLFEDSSAKLRCRIDRDDGTGTAAVQADFSGILLSIYDLSNPRNKIMNDVALTIGSVVYNTLQLPWSMDALGFNFSYTILTTMLPKGGRTHRFDIRFTFATGFVAHGAWDVPTLDLKRS